MAKIDNIEDQLRRDEDVVPWVYDDATGKAIVKGSTVIGYPTVGAGFLVDKDKGGRILPEEITFILKNRIRLLDAELEKRIPWIKNLDHARRGIIQNMAFQLGINGLLNFKRTLSFIESGDYSSASGEMLNSTWAKQTPNRAARLSRQMITGVWQ